MNMILRSISGPRRPWYLKGTILALVLTLATATVVTAIILPSTFNAADGNTKAESYPIDKDWENLGITCPSGPGSGSGCDVDEPTGKTDNAFGQGAKEDAPEPTVVFGSIPNNKSDLLRMYIFNEKVAESDFLYLGWVRVNDPRGTTNMDFELNQNKCEYVNGTPTAESKCSANGVTPERKANDLLILYDWSGGGANPGLSYSRWIITSAEPASAACEANNSYPCWSKRANLAGNPNVEASVNDLTLYPTASDYDEVTSMTIGYRTFGEASINMTGLGIFPADQCVNYGSAYLKSRSSDSFNAELKDFIAPIPVNVSNCGTLKVIKVASPESGQTFSFTTTGQDGYSLADDGTGQSDTKEFKNLFSGDYTIAEILPAGWDLESISCESKQDGTTGSIDLENASVTVSIASDDFVTCTFTNEKDAFIVVDKVTDPSGDPQSFGFTASWMGGNPADVPDFALTGGDTPYNSGDLAPGNYAVAELSQDGWDLTGTACVSSKGDTESAGAISLQAGETVTCTFTNQKDAFIVVDKVTDPSGDPQLFGFTASWMGGNPADAVDFALTDGDTPYNSGDLVPGNYAVAELSQQGWGLTGTACVSSKGDTESTGAISLQAGETVTCTFTNTKLGKIKVVKQTNPDGAPGTFQFLGDLSGYIGDGESLISGYLSPGTYSVKEFHPDWHGDGYKLMSISCDDGESDTPSTWDLGTLTATFGLDPGEEVTCTFTNATGAIRITKLAKDAGRGSGDHPLAGVTFTLSGGNLYKGATLTGITDANGEVCFDDLAPGYTFSVEETVPANYQLASGQENPRNITATPGATCDLGTPDETTFLNIPLSEIEVIFTSLAGEGVTVSNIICVFQEGEAVTPLKPVPDDETPEGMDDLHEIYTGLLPGTYICTIVVDP